MAVSLAMAFSITTAGPASQPPLTAVSGFVRDANGPVAGATVRVKATDKKGFTDMEGHFSLSDLSPNEPVVLTAWAEGYFIGGGKAEYLPGVSDIEIALTAHSDMDNPDYAWLSAFAGAGYEGSGENTSCENCHADPNNPQAALPFSEWLKDAHALSAKNSRFLAMYNGTDMAGNQSPATQYFHIRDYGRIPLRPDPNEGYYSGLPGKVFAKVLEELWTDVSPTGAYWNPTRLLSDNRIAAFAADSSTYTFVTNTDDTATVDVVLLFRRTFINLASQKDWEIPDIIMESKVIRVLGP